MVRILIVDDEPAIRQLVRRYAELEDYQVSEAANGFEAVELCRQDVFDVIVMDVMMPDMDGFAATREIRKHCDTPVLMLSARGTEVDKLYGFELGIDDYVVKPFSPRELMARLKVMPGDLQGDTGRARLRLRRGKRGRQGKYVLV